MAGKLCKVNHEVVDFQKKFTAEEMSAVISVGFKSSHRIRSVGTEWSCNQVMYLCH